MSTPQLVPIDEDMLTAFLSRDTTVMRLCHKDTGWFFGIVGTISFENGMCLLKAERYCHTKRDIPKDQDDFEVCGDTLTALGDRHHEPAVEHDRRSFMLKSPQQVITDDPLIFTIRAIGESVVLSQRPVDSVLVGELLTVKT